MIKSLVALIIGILIGAYVTTGQFTPVKTVGKSIDKIEVRDSRSRKCKWIDNYQYSCGNEIINVRVKKVTYFSEENNGLK